MDVLFKADLAELAMKWDRVLWCTLHIDTILCSKLLGEVDIKCAVDLDYF